MASNDVRPDLEQMREALVEPLERALGAAARSGRVDYLCDPKEVADDPAKLVVRDASGRALAVVLVSSPVEPDLVGRGMRIAHAVRERLGEPLGAVILEPLGEGTLSGSSYAILPYRRPLAEGRFARRFQRLRIRRSVLDWLAQVNAATVQAAPATETHDAFERPLEHLASLEPMHASVRTAAGRALQTLRDRGWRPLRVFMHGDLWEDNLLHAARTPAEAQGPTRFPFVVIDWPGATLRGYPFYDLLRIARSMRLGRSGLRREVARHRVLLEANAAGARGHLLACLGHIGLNLGCFPMEMYVEMSRTCLEDLETALAGARD